MLPAEQDHDRAESTWRTRLGTALRYGYVLRFPLLFSALLVGLAVLGRSNSALFSNLFLIEDRTHLTIAIGLSLLAAWLCGFTAVLIIRLVPFRLNLPRIWPSAGALPRWIPAWLIGRSAWAPAPAWVVALPLVWVLVARAELAVRDRILSLCAGAALALVLLVVAERLRRRILESRLRRGLLARLLERIARWLGPGFYKKGRALPGHALALATFGGLLVLYIIGYYTLRPDRALLAWPVLGYMLFMHMLLLSGLAGLSFFFDRYRTPVLLLLVAASALFYNLSDTDHYVRVYASDEFEPVDPVEAVRTRLAPGDSVLTVVTASGGGIQAAAWTATVLTGLQHEIPAFARSIHLLSTVSGGAVGTLFFIEGYDPAWNRPVPPEGAMPAGTARLRAIRDGASTSSLEASAWGYAFPDLLRALVPFAVNEMRDRGWAIEQSWSQRLRAMRRSIGAAHPDSLSRLSSWADSVRSGALPAVIMNTTVVESGARLLWSPLRVSAFANRADPRRIPSSSPQELYRTKVPVDIYTVSAARTSATFPYVTPIAAPSFASGRQDSIWHLADGGYYDNQGVMSALEWIQAVLADATLRARLKRIVIVQILAFPPEPDPPPDEPKGWVHATVGPLLAAIEVRTTTQVERNKIELSLLEQVYPNRIKIASFQPDSGKWPLSWHLSTAEQRALQTSWDSLAHSPQVDSVRTWINP